MARFTYVSRTSGGERITAIGEADTRQDLLLNLKNRGLTVVDVKEIGGKAKKGASDLKSRIQELLRKEITVKRIDTGELAIFWRQFATMNAAGLSILDALQSIAEEHEHPRFKKILGEVAQDMWDGKNFSESLARHPKVFSPMVTSLIGAAEESGSLPEVTEQVASFLENRDKLIRKVRAALSYPIFLVGFFLCVMAVSTFWIIPKFESIYKSFNAKLPVLTEIVFSFNALFLKFLPWIAGAAVLAIAAVIMWFQRPSGRAFRDNMLLKMPLFGSLVLRAGVARFCRSLAILLYGGIPINRALEMVGETTGNSVIAGAVKRAREEILKGNKIAASLRKQKVFPNMASRMVSAGEETGNLSGLLQKAAEFYEARVDAAITTINSLIEPIIIVIIGGFVLIFVLALYMPIFTLALNMRG